MVLSSFLITSRETLEAALVIGIVLAYLSKTGNAQYKKTVYYGIIFGIILSILAAVSFTLFAGGFEGTSGKIFEGFWAYGCQHLHCPPEIFQEAEKKTHGLPGFQR